MEGTGRTWIFRDAKEKLNRNWTGGIGALIMTSLDIYTQKIKSTTRHESSSPVVWTRPLPIHVVGFDSS